MPITVAEVRIACAQYNDNPKSHDAQQELRRCLSSLRCVYLAADKIDVDRTARLFEFCMMTSSTGRADAKTVADLLQVVTGVIEASPYDGRPLFEGLTAEGVDYSDVPTPKRRLISFAMLTGEPIGTEREAVDAVMEPSSHFKHIAKKLAALEAKQPKTADEQRLLLDIDLRMQWTRESESQRRPVLPIERISEQLNRPTLRALMQRMMRTTEDFDAWVLDYFPSIYRRYSSGMDRSVRENLLLQCIGEAEIQQALKSAGYVRW